MEAKKWRYDYKPGRTPEELEEDRIVHSLQQTPEKRYAQFISLLRLGKKLEATKAGDLHGKIKE